jgi:hypothetical protein
MIGEPGVSLIVPSRRCFRDHRYYDRLRPPDARLAALCSSLALRYHAFTLGFARRQQEQATDAVDLFSRFPPGASAWKHQALSSSRVIPLWHALLSRPRWCPFRSPYRYGDCCLPMRPYVGFGSDALELSYCPPLYVFRGSITRPAHLFRPASHLSLRKRTRASLPTCRLGFSRMGLEQTSLSPTGQQ